MCSQNNYFLSNLLTWLYQKKYKHQWLIYLFTSREFKNLGFLKSKMSISDQICSLNLNKQIYMYRKNYISSLRVLIHLQTRCLAVFFFFFWVKQLLSIINKSCFHSKLFTRLLQPNWCKSVFPKLFWLSPPWDHNTSIKIPQKMLLLLYP